ncbi:MAG: DUF1858 domain-containing protein [Firmicutes bacterium]|nr:DUF1858 domain-containing protein [Bacillota bacterium]
MIHKDLLVSEVLEKYEGVGQVFKIFGLNCLGCEKARTETLEQAANGHGVDLDKLLMAIHNYAKGMGGCGACGGGCGGR